MDSRVIPTLVCLLIVVAIIGLIALGWNNRKKRQSDIAPLAEVPPKYDDAPAEVGIPGTYVVTTRMGDWLDRIAVHTLGAKSPAQALIFDDALIIARDGAQDIYIPSSEISVVRLDSGISGKFVEKDGLVVISWQHHGVDLDTGFRTQFAEDKRILVERLQLIAPQAHHELPVQS